MADARGLFDRSTIEVLLVSAVVGGIAVLVQLPLTNTALAPVLFKAAEAFAFTVTAMLLARSARQRGNGALIALATSSLIAGWVRPRWPGPLPLLFEIWSPFAWCFIGWALLRYPDSALQTRQYRNFIAALFLWIAFGHGVLSIMDDATYGPAAPFFGHWKPVIPIAHSTVNHLHEAFDVVDALLAVVYVLFVIQRLRRLRGIDRWSLAPVGASILAGSVPLFVKVPNQIFGNGRDHTWQLLAQDAALLFVPIAFVAVLLRDRLAQAGTSDLVRRLAGAPADVDIVAILRDALRDPDLTVLYWLGERSQYVDAAGIKQPEPDPAQHLVLPIDGRDGSRLAVLVADPSLARHRLLVDAAVSASSLTLENGHLHAELRHQLEQLVASRRRIAEVGVEERRRLERDLHDGAQQRLLALSLNLTRMKVQQTTADEVISAAQDQVHAASKELRDLAHGIHPGLLSQAGLSAAVGDVAQRLPLPVEIGIGPERWPAPIETTAYFVICELLTNATKHSKASAVQVIATRAGQSLQVTVSDNGIGGADERSGTGLRGVVDRVRALGGELSVISPPSRGTTVQVVLPCE